MNGPTAFWVPSLPDAGCCEKNNSRNKNPLQIALPVHLTNRSYVHSKYYYNPNDFLCLYIFLPCSSGFFNQIILCLNHLQLHKQKLCLLQTNHSLFVAFFRLYLFQIPNSIRFSIHINIVHIIINMKSSKSKQI